VTGTIFVRPGVKLWVRTVSFGWILEELRSRITEENRAALTAALQAYDAEGMEWLRADELDANAFRTFGREFDELTSKLQDEQPTSDLLPFLEQVQAAIHDDPRWLAA